MLTDKRIKEEVVLKSAYNNGCNYFNWGYVNNLHVYNKERNEFSAIVVGSKGYKVFIRFDIYGELGDYQCDCPAFREYDGACKHVVAVLKEIQLRWNELFGIKKKAGLRGNTKALFDYFNHIHSEDNFRKPDSAIVNTRVVPIFCFSIVTGQKRNWLEFSVGNDRLYVMKNVKNFIEAVINGTEIDYGKKFVFQPDEAVYDEKTAAFIELLRSAYFDEKNLSIWSDHYKSNHYSNYNTLSFFEKRKFILSNSSLLQFFEIMKDENFEVSINDNKIRHTAIIEGRPDFKLAVNGIQNGVKVTLDLEGDVYYGLDHDFKYIYHKNAIYKTDSTFANYVAPLMKCFVENRKQEIFVPATEIQGFFSNVVPELEKIAVVHVDTSLLKNYYKEDLEKQVYFDQYEGGISAKVNFKYGELEINPADHLSETNLLINKKTLLRDIKEENKLVNVFSRYDFATQKGMFVQKNEDRIYDFLQEGLEEIRQVSEVFYSDAFQNMNVRHTGMIAIGVRINSGTGFLEMNMQYENIDKKELIDLLASYKLKKRYHRLKDGQFLSLDSSEFQSTAELIDQLELSHADLSKKIIELPKSRAMYIDSLVREKGDLQIERSSAFKKMVQDISEPQDMEFDIPKGIQGKLRDYQKTGFKWLKTISYYGFGGILADDMGLGKTLQIITLVKSENQNEKKPSLVIAPTSLVYNWQDEVRKFAPDLTVAVLSGTQSERRERFDEIESSDLVVTSYGMIKRDIELYQDIHFKFCFIDEAQHIKNPNTLNAKAVKQIKAGGYFALTGTPVENTLTELWSIFDFIMPGYLLSHSKFIKKFEAPIVKNEDKEVLKELGRHIKPFLLRRMKKEVLKELPEKIESKMINEMTAEQEKVYVAYLLKAKKELEEELTANGFENSRIKILAILTRLRQICCHPALFIENYKGGSGKLEMLIELLQDAVDGGHRILVFSQFTSMLSLIRNELDKSKMKYYYLDGATPAKERINLVNSFNGGEKDLFLISLKAGGTGLNLTGADVVVHFDPWWNPAVEDQATDRAYRIGQKNAVQVFKLITKNTIEERIFELQQKKKELIDAVIKPGENFLTRMTVEEVRELFHDAATM